jgi:hypothetical protein
MALNSLTINEKGRGETNASSIIPYPPAYVKRNDTWEEVDLSQDLTKLIAQDPLQLTQLEVDELKLAKARFACLFAAIFASPIKIPTALLEDQITKEIETAVASQSNAVFYPYYHVFVTDQDLSIDKKKSTVRADIGSKLGTLNLYTRHPLCDTGLGLIRDTLEAIYDTVRDAEILTAYVRKPYYPDNKFIDHWIMRYVEPWFSVPYKLDVVNSSHPAWHHNGIQNSKQYVREVCSDLLEGFYPPKDTNEKDILPKLFFQTESNKVTPDSQRYFLYCYNILIERVIDHQITWSAPRSKWFPPFMPSFLFFLGLRALVHEAIEGEAAHTFPESIEFGSNHDTSWVEIKLKALNGESLQKRWIEKIDTQIKQNKLPILTGYCGELYRLWKGIIRISDSAKEELDTISLSNLFVKEVNIITICVQSNSAKLTWDNPKVEK